MIFSERLRLDGRLDDSFHAKTLAGSRPDGWAFECSGSLALAGRAHLAAYGS